MKGKTVCRRYWLPKEMIERPVLEALSRHIRSFGRVESIRAQVEALLAEHTPVSDARTDKLQERLAEIEEKRYNWEAAIDKGLDIDQAVESLNRLDREKKAIKRELLAAGAQPADLDVQAISKDILKSLDRLEEVLKAGSVAEVKAILRAYIGRVEYDPNKNKARIGFFPLPTETILSTDTPENAIFSMVAGVGFEPTTYGL